LLHLPQRALRFCLTTKCQPTNSSNIASFSTFFPEIFLKFITLVPVERIAGFAFEVESLPSSNLRQLRQPIVSEGRPRSGKPQFPKLRTSSGPIRQQRGAEEKENS
jgi:hypothetical protein